MKLYFKFLVLSVIVFPACNTPKKAHQEKKGATSTAINDDNIEVEDSRFDKEEEKTPRRRFTQKIQSFNHLEEDVTISNVSSDCIEAEPLICEIELEIVKQVNDYRKKQGLSELQNSPKLSWVARDWSKSQAKSGRIGHAGFPRKRSSVFQEKFNSTPALRAENVAYSYFRSQGAKAVATGLVQMWIHSPGHRRNIVGNHKIIGVGIARTSAEAYYGTQIFGVND